MLDSDDDTATQMAQDMAAEDILILLWESRGGGEENYQPVAVSPRITPDDFTPIEGFASTHAVGRIFFTSRGRFFDLMVEFGTTSPDAAQLARANDVLRTLRIESQRT